jgi:hypothetical protein
MVDFSSFRFLNNVSPYSSPYSPVSAGELPDKFGFTENDRYLIGNETCGSYLFIGPTTFNQLNVNGTDARATKTVNVGDENAITIPIVFQFRMEDYYNPPFVGGYGGPSAVYPTQLQYSRRIGVDIYAQDETVFLQGLINTSQQQQSVINEILNEKVSTNSLMIATLAVLVTFLILYDII